MSDNLRSEARRLEDLFFHRQDALLVQKRRELEQMQRTQQALSEASGITNPHVLARLVELEVTPDVVASLAVVPLVEVAWADGKIDPKEREAILHGADGIGAGRGTVNRELLEEWLKTRPPEALLSAWIHYIEGLSESLAQEERQELETALVARARAVAEAAGGFLGLGRISDAEQRVLARMEAAFRAGPA